MPVRFKGLSEYKRNFKWKKSGLQESCRPSQEQTSSWAGLRSDQLGIIREPNFISKRKVPYYNPQISKSFEWRGDNNLNALPEAEVPGPTELHADHNNNDINQDKVETPDAPRLPKTVRSHSADSRVESAIALAGNTKKKSPPATPVRHNSASVSPKKHLDKVEDGFHRVLQKKAGMNIFPLTSFPRSSEYQSQFIWKTPQELSPILAAERVIHNASKSIPTFKSPVVTPETEYERSFKVSVPPKEQKVRNDLEEEEKLPICEQINLSPDGKNTRKEMFLKSTEDSSKQGKSETEQKQPKQKNKQHVTQKPFSFYTSLRKMNTEYRSKFLSPAQYVYKDGAWSRIRHNVPNQGFQNTLNSVWYMEVKELREKAKSYRQQVHGTHFSRYHLNQILSDNNSLWDVSSNSSSEETISNNIKALDLAGVLEKQRSPNPAILQQPESAKYTQQKNTEKLGMSDASTVPVRRRLVWGEQEKKEQMENQLPAVKEEEGKEKKQETAGAQKLEENDQEVNVENKIEEENASLLNSSADASELSSVSSKKGGRLPTPKLKELGGGQRTHHDLTTPAVGGAVLVSPPKVTSPSPQQRKKEVLETDASAYKQVIREASKRKSSRHEGEVEAVSQLTSPAAGLKTLDPLPLRKDFWPATKASDERASPAPAHAECSITSPVLKSVKEHTSSYWGPSRRIQGTLRDPEFQHNGNVASPKMKRFQLPLQERNYEDEDDRLSQISARSAASSSLASQVLERAQKRKENFWGKT
ncbi:PREDICTED: nuclear protein MDM1 isoform X2 [Crocodylus porosus]|uniref:nuclear protein MDM1 isoform X2 n=1 Tax=Crocodylus porosus TaxID=8502 RepID=UPI00093CA34C|nr:PREDICTED: nuclear protein MDM1 isoform X2 [Crocodylus porosus]